MIISERIFKILKDKNMTQMEFAKRAGFSNSAISDWKRKKQILLRKRSWIYATPLI